MHHKMLVLLSSSLLLFAFACGSEPDERSPEPPRESTEITPVSLAPTTEPTPADTSAFSLASTAFTHGAAIPEKHWNLVCSKGNVSPQLSWSGAPKSVRGFALIVDDPDPAPIIHWVVYGMKAGRTGLGEGVTEAEGIKFGASGRDGTGWWGPCPRAGRPAHDYIFTLYALSEQVGLDAGVTKDELLDAVEGKVIATASLTGTAQQ